MLSFQRFLNEAVQQREGNIQLKSLRAGLNPVVISLPTQRNPERIGEIRLETYTEGTRTYKFQPTGELQAQMNILTSMTGAADEKNADAVKVVEEKVKEMESELTRDLLQIFTELDEKIYAVLKKYNAV